MVDLRPAKSFSPLGGDIFRGQMGVKNGVTVDVLSLSDTFAALQLLNGSKYRHTMCEANVRRKLSKKCMSRGGSPQGRSL